MRILLIRDKAEGQVVDLRVLVDLVLRDFERIGAIVGAMIAIHSAAAKRKAEIGTFRALGFHRRRIPGTVSG